jgi:hypothetical protein
MNMKKIVVKDKVHVADETGAMKETYVINEQETTLAQDKAQLISKKFQDYISSAC